VQPEERRQADSSVSPDASAGEKMPEQSSEKPVATTRCDVTADSVTCAPRKSTLSVGAFVKTPRTVYWQIPDGTTPEGGWPVAILFQGSFFSSKWTATKTSPFGGYYQAQAIRRLLENGIAVMTPLALGEGSTYWNTNVPPYLYNWSIAPDHEMMKALFASIEKGEFGKLNPKVMYAFGFSSGGYMTSRMAVSYPGRFRALVIHSGSYATCGGSLCAVPTLPKDHPPTLFLYGKRDAIVPLWTIESYVSGLQKQKTPVSLEVDTESGHEWIPKTPTLVVDWFKKH
jgi:dienelactone hydrolase